MTSKSPEEVEAASLPSPVSEVSAELELSAAAEAYTVHTLQKRPKTLDFYNSLAASP